MGFKKNPRSAASTTNWWSETQEAPRAAVPDADAMGRKARRYRYLVWAAVFLAPLVLFLNLAMIVGNSDSGTTGAGASVYQKYNATRSLAMVTVRKWLSGTPSPLPGGVLIGWDSATTRNYTPPKNSADSEDAYQIQTHVLTVSAPNGVLYTTDVNIAVSKTGGNAVIGTPSLTPDTDAVAGWDADPYPQYASVDATDAVTAAIQQWAEVYTKGDSDTIRQAIGDQSSNHAYAPLQGATLRDLSIVGAWSKSETETSRIWVRVSAAITWAYGPKYDDTTDQATVTFDVLVARADSGAPVVVAWGGPGTGPSLKPYQNAYTPTEGSETSDSRPSGNSQVGNDEPTGTEKGTGGTKAGGGDKSTKKKAGHASGDSGKKQPHSPSKHGKAKR